MDIYNHERPHEALSQVPPARVYEPSPRSYDGVLRSPDYEDDAEIRRVRRSGEIKWQGRLIFVSEVLIGEPLGLYRIGEDVWLVKYGPIVLGTIKGKGKLTKIKAAAARSRTPKERPASPAPPPSPARQGRASDGGSEGKAA